MATKTAATVLGMALCTLPMLAMAADSGERPEFKKADSNGDGKISVSEATSVGVPKGEARREDIDNDGKLTKADWKFVDMKGSGGGSSSSSS